MAARRAVRLRLLRNDPAPPSGGASAPFGLQDKDGKLQPPLRRADGMHTVSEDGLRKVLAGLTTIEEVLRVPQEA